MRLALPKFLTSVFFKLLVIILMAGLGINLAIIFFIGAYRHHIGAAYEPHITRYVDNLVKELGSPPQLQRARQLAAETGMIITYKAPQVKWSTSSHPLEIPEHRIRVWHQNRDIRAGSYHGTHVVYIRHGNGRLSFYLGHQPEAEKKIKVLGIGLLVYITLLMIGAYFTIRWVLSPLRSLKHGVAQVARGKLSHRVPLKRSDELTDLSASFNAMTERLQQLIKSKEQLLLDVSHELRTPITRMKVALALLLESQGKKSIEEDLDEMEAKITELLETARALNTQTTLNRRPTDLADLIRDVAARLENVPPGIKITASPSMDPVAIDAEQIRKALKNIVDNALKYSSPGGPAVQVALAFEDRFAEIAVRDQGKGIPEKDLDFIFEPFYRVDKSRSTHTGGYGLGLSLSKTIVEAHGGRIDISSVLGEGTRVTLYLPI